MLHYLYTGEFLSERTTRFASWMRSVTSATSKSLPTTSNASSRTPELGLAEDSSKTSIPPTMSAYRRLILAYQIADKLDIESIKDQVFSFFQKSGASAFLLADTFADDLELFYNVTRNNDLYLRGWVTQHCIIHSPELLSKPEVIVVMKDHEPMAWALGVLNQAKLESMRQSKIRLAGKLRSCATSLEASVEKEQKLNKENITLTEEKTILSSTIVSLMAEKGKLQDECNAAKAQVVQLTKKNRQSANAQKRMRIQHSKQLEAIHQQDRQERQERQQRQVRQQQQERQHRQRQEQRPQLSRHDFDALRPIPLSIYESITGHRRA